MKPLFAIIALFIALSSCENYKQSINAGQKYNIDSLTVRKSPCFGTCPVYTLAISNNSEANLEATRYLKNNLEGKYKTQISKADMQNLVKELNKLDFPNLNEEYGDNRITDLPSTDLEIRYNDQNVKHIHDYGNRGTPALTKFYNLMDSLVYAQQWKKIN